MKMRARGYPKGLTSRLIYGSALTRETPTLPTPRRFSTHDGVSYTMQMHI